MREPRGRFRGVRWDGLFWFADDIACVRKGPCQSPKAHLDKPGTNTDLAQQQPSLLCAQTQVPAFG